MGREQSWSEAGVEPNLAEALSDPVVALVMRRDGLAPEQVWQAVRESQARLRRTGSPHAGPRRSAA
jgi:hypothetical protein